MPHMHPLIVGLYCVENNAPGGESIVVDGYRVAADLEREAPEDFARLCRTPVTFRQFDPAAGYHFTRTTPILRCDAQGAVTAVTFSHKNFSVDLPFEEMGLLLSRLHRSAGAAQGPGLSVMCSSSSRSNCCWSRTNACCMAGPPSIIGRDRDTSRPSMSPGTIWRDGAISRRAPRSKRRRAGIRRGLEGATGPQERAATSASRRFMRS